MNALPPVPQLRWGPMIGEMRALKLKADFERMVRVAREIVREQTDLRDMIAATTVLHQCEEWLAKTIEHREALKRLQGRRGPGCRGEAPATKGQGRPAFAGAGSADLAPSGGGNAVISTGAGPPS